MICFKKCEINNFLAILELYAFCIENKKVKFTVMNFRGRNNAKYFMQTQVLRLLKINTKSTHFLPAKKIPILWIEPETNKIQKVSKPYI